LTSLLLGTNLLPFGGKAYLVPQFYSPDEANRTTALLLVKLPWAQEHVTLYVKAHPLPRQTA
jgi:hypothetical protein